MPMAVEAIGVHDQLYKNRAVERMAELPQLTDIFRILQPEIQTDLRLGEFHNLKDRMF